MENLLDMIAEKIIKERDENWCSSLVMTYAYEQVPLHPETAKQCNFYSIGGEATGTYRFVTDFYGLTFMPPECQKVSDLLSAKF